MKVAIVYDRVNKWGGAERVLLSLHKIFPSAPLYTSLYSTNAGWAKVFPEIRSSSLDKIKFLQNKHEYLPLFMPLIFESFDFSEFDLVISVTSEFAKGIITGPKTKHICYCLTPTRYLWSGYEDYFKSSVIKFISGPVVWYLRYWDKIAAQRPDKIIAISTEVKARVKKYYELKSQILFPPVGIQALKNNKNREYYLIVSRLVPYKKVDLAVKVFNELGLPLIIVGDGSEKKYLQKIAKNNIKFVGFVPEVKLKNYYSKAVALIMPQIEDFGLVAIEAMSFGVPVVAYKEGGILDIITKNTGILFNEQSVESLMSAIKKFEFRKFKRNDLLKTASKFSFERFKKELLHLISSLQ